MRDDELLTHVQMAFKDGATTPGEAIDRVQVRLLKGLIRENLDRMKWLEKRTTGYEAELDKLLAEHGWEDSVDAEDDTE